MRRETCTDSPTAHCCHLSYGCSCPTESFKDYAGEGQREFDSICPQDVCHRELNDSDTSKLARGKDDKSLFENNAGQAKPTTSTPC